VNFFLSIDSFLEFSNISHIREETTYEDIKNEFPELTEETIKQYEKYLKENYMRNNDFLFISRKELDEK
jgi:hypothetical protein